MMAKLVYLREGTDPDRISYGAEISLQNLMSYLGDRPPIYMGLNLPTLPTNRPDLSPLRDPTQVFIYVTASEGEGDLERQGYYRLEGVSPPEAAEWR